MSRRVLPLLVLLAVFGACDAEPESPIERAEFIAAYIDLRQAAVDGTLDSIMRDSILAAHDVTEADLRAYIDAHAADPDAISDTWREIGDSMIARADTIVAEPDTTP